MKKSDDELKIDILDIFGDDWTKPSVSPAPVEAAVPAPAPVEPPPADPVSTSDNSAVESILADLPTEPAAQEVTLAPVFADTPTPETAPISEATPSTESA